MRGRSQPNYCITPYEDDVDNSAKDIITKRSRDRDELAGPLNSNDVDVLHPKRIQLLNLIERFIPRLEIGLGIQAPKDN